MWKHKSHGKRKYKGTYVRDASGERQFVLIAILESGKVHAITCESHQMAKKVGWVKVA